MLVIYNSSSWVDDVDMMQVRACVCMQNMCDVSWTHKYITIALVWGSLGLAPIIAHECEKGHDPSSAIFHSGESTKE